MTQWLNALVMSKHIQTRYAYEKNRPSVHDFYNSISHFHIVTHKSQTRYSPRYRENQYRKLSNLLWDFVELNEKKIFLLSAQDKQIMLLSLFLSTSKCNLFDIEKRHEQKAEDFVGNKGVKCGKKYALNLKQIKRRTTLFRLQYNRPNFIFIDREVFNNSIDEDENRKSSRRGKTHLMDQLRRWKWSVVNFDEMRKPCSNWIEKNQL